MAWDCTGLVISVSCVKWRLFISLADNYKWQFQPTKIRRKKIYCFHIFCLYGLILQLQQLHENVYDWSSECPSLFQVCPTSHPPPFPPPQRRVKANALSLSCHIPSMLKRICKLARDVISPSSTKGRACVSRLTVRQWDWLDWRAMPSCLPFDFLTHLLRIHYQEHTSDRNEIAVRSRWRIQNRWARIRQASESPEKETTPSHVFMLYTDHGISNN